MDLDNAALRSTVVNTVVQRLRWLRSPVPLFHGSQDALVFSFQPRSAARETCATRLLGEALADSRGVVRVRVGRNFLEMLNPLEPIVGSTPMALAKLPEAMRTLLPQALSEMSLRVAGPSHGNSTAVVFAAVQVVAMLATGSSLLVNGRKAANKLVPVAVERLQDALHKLSPEQLRLLPPPHGQHYLCFQPPAHKSSLCVFTSQSRNVVLRLLPMSVHNASAVVESALAFAARFGQPVEIVHLPDGASPNMVLPLGFVQLAGPSFVRRTERLLQPALSVVSPRSFAHLLPGCQCLVVGARRLTELSASAEDGVQLWLLHDDAACGALPPCTGCVQAAGLVETGADGSVQVRALAGSSSGTDRMLLRRVEILAAEREAPGLAVWFDSPEEAAAHAWRLGMTPRGAALHKEMFP